MHKNTWIISIFVMLLVVAGCTSTSTIKTTQTDNADLLDRIYNTDPQRKFIGEDMIDFKFTDIITGNTYSLKEDFKDKVVVIETFSVGCPACAEGIGNYNKLYDKYGEKVEIIYLDISEFDTKNEIVSIKQQYNGRDWKWVDFQQALKPFFEKYNIYANDQTFIVKGGKIAYADSFKVPISRIDKVIGDLV